ncbi:MAG: hypothetical protein ACOX1R_03055 [Caldicoprobacterales bacterium]|nr:hypothetical protein [Clostridiales bacterium]
MKKFLCLCVFNLMILNFFTLPVDARHSNVSVDDDPSFVDSLSQRETP